ncbi:ABC-type transport auxiliary lipoprotein family protein [Pseudomonas saliphila]|uniref:ABC-type transport auxiliary lipoprotein family protein n=1 Tax=Pseudomonas saliphila TaxID=2586906 RepID=UPI00123BD4CC|nr:ABC-type transport auxiliary lipoprotein family protein [Pseudomonas saliphila]
MNTLSRLLGTSTLIGSLLWLSACTVLPESDPVTVFEFPAPTMQAAGSSERIDVSLRINTPLTGFALAGPRILVNPDGYELKTYKGARWTDPSPVLLREYIAQSFNQHGVIANVSTDEHGLHADVHLSSNLRRFQVVYAEGAEVVIELDARLVEAGSLRVLAHHTFISRQPLEDEQLPGVVTAYGQASEALTAELLPWTLQALRDRIISQR